MLVEKGFEGKIITTSITAQIIEPLFKDSAYINFKDAELLSKKRGIDYPPIYSEQSAVEVMSYIYEYGYDEIHQLDDNISFRFLRNSHIVGAAQLELFIKDDSSHIKKILYTSDLGNTTFKKPFVDEMEYCKTANLVICESTYGADDRTVKKEVRQKDIEKLKTVIQDVVIENKHSILIPCFSLDRSQFILKLLYDLYHDKPEFDHVKIVIDSPLTKKITDLYGKFLEGENKEIIDEIVNWSNARFITDSQESKASVADKSPKIVISASGFLDQGRSKHYLKEYISNINNAIVFVGFATPTSLAGRIKNGTEQKTITIDGKKYKNAIKVICLTSFSSHMQQKDLINYLKSINCEKIALCHGDKEAKKELSERLKEELSKIGKTSRVVVPQRGSVIHL
jgi:metallo-beta-lactamase family protein